MTAAASFMSSFIIIFSAIMVHCATQGDHEILHLDAIVAHREKRHDDALKLIDSAIATFHDKSGYAPPSALPVASNLWNTKGVLYKGLGDMASALAAFDVSVRLDGAAATNYNAYYNRANLLHYNVVSLLDGGGNSSREDEASSHGKLEILIGALKSNGREVASAASALRFALQDYKIADTILSVKISSNSKDFEQNIDYVSFLNDYAIALKKHGDTSSAIEVLLRAVKRDPDDLTARGNLVIALKAVNMLEEAKHHSLEAMRIAPDNAQIRHNYGLVLQASDQVDSARNQWLKAIDLDSSMFHSKSSLGHCEGNRGNLTGAQHWYTQAIDDARRVRIFPSLIFRYILFYSFLFFLFYSILFYSILFYSFFLTCCFYKQPLQNMKTCALYSNHPSQTLYFLPQLLFLSARRLG